MASPIVAILNCYSPATGANLAQIVIRGAGPVQIMGDEAIARLRLGQVINAPLPPSAPHAGLRPALHPQPLPETHRPPRPSFP